MKKFLALVLALVLSLSLIACGETTTTEPTTTPSTPTTEPDTTPSEPTVQGPATAVEVLEAAWNQYAEDEKFMVMGGDFNNMVDGGPGTVGLTGTEENPLYNLYVPETELANITDAAIMMFAMNANTFTTGALKLAEGADVAAFAATMKDTLLNNQWVCGQPERLVIVAVNDVVVITFGLDGVEFPDDGSIVTPFVDRLVAAYDYAEVLCNELFVV